MIKQEYIEYNDIQDIRSIQNTVTLSHNQNDKTRLGLKVLNRALDLYLNHLGIDIIYKKG